MSVIGGWIALVAFWVLLARGVATGRLGRTWAVIFVMLWAISTFGLPRLSLSAGLYTTPVVAILDIVLVLIVSRGDVRFW